MNSVKNTANIKMSEICKRITGWVGRQKDLEDNNNYPIDISDKVLISDSSQSETKNSCKSEFSRRTVSESTTGWTGGDVNMGWMGGDVEVPAQQRRRQKRLGDFYD